jgi:hypothetical protein
MKHLRPEQFIARSARCLSHDPRDFHSHFIKVPTELIHLFTQGLKSIRQVFTVFLTNFHPSLSLFLLDMMKISPGIRHHSFFWTTGMATCPQIHVIEKPGSQTWCCHLRMSVIYFRSVRLQTWRHKTMPNLQMSKLIIYEVNKPSNTTSWHVLDQ